MLNWLYVGLTAFVLSFVAVPLLRKFALRYQFVDQPGQRKIHKEPLPLLGGAAIFGGFALASVLGLVTGAMNAVRFPYYGLLLGASLLFLIGLVDDYFKTRGQDFSAAVRFGVQIVAAGLVAFSGGTVHGLGLPFGNHHYVAFPHYLAILVTIVWIVGVVNVFNFLDGVDGLAAGIGAISALTLFLIAVLKHDAFSAVMSISLVGACLGFLRHNFYPARIIMGDAGSTVIGFLLASISVIGALKSATVVSVLVPVLALGVPIFDGLRVVFVRALRGQPVYQADKTHGHHRLLSAGFSQVQTVTLMYIVSACFSLVSMIVVLLDHKY